MTKQHDVEKTETENREGRKLTRDEGLVGEEGLAGVDISVTVWLHSGSTAADGNSAVGARLRAARVDGAGRERTGRGLWVVLAELDARNEATRVPVPILGRRGQGGRAHRGGDDRGKLNMSRC